MSRVQHYSLRALAIALGISLLVVFGVTQPAAAATERVYIALGDSISAGLVSSLPRKRGYPALVTDELRSLHGSTAADTEVMLQNLSRPGETTTSFMQVGQLAAFEAEVASLRERGAELDLVTISLGGNDILRLREQDAATRQAGLDQFRQDYPAAIAAVRASLGDLQPVIVVNTYYDLSEGNVEEQGSDAWWVDQFNDVIREAGASAGLAVADLEPAFRGRIRDLTWHPTDIHPNNAGHREIARLVWQASGLDTEVPVITFEQPGDALARRTATVRASVSDNVGVSSVELWVDGEFTSTLIYVASADAYLGVWDARGHDSPDATLAIRAVDLAGNKGQVEKVVRVVSESGG